MRGYSVIKNSIKVSYCKIIHSFSENNAPNICNFKRKSYLCTAIERKRPDGGIGRRAGLKHQWIHFHPGSIPGLGTIKPS